VKKFKAFSLILPAFNEADNLPLLFERIADEFPRKHATYEIILVDDHSTDDTHEVARRYKRRLPMRVIRNPTIGGKGAALRFGITQARYPILVTMDADNQYVPSSIRAMMEKIEEGFDLVVADRNYFRVPWMRILMSRVFSQLVCSSMLSLPYDVLGGLKVIRRKHYHLLQIVANNWAFDLELAWKAKQAGMSLTQVSVPVSIRSHGQSKLEPFRDFLDLLATAWRLRSKGS
jgi:dolichol-phosphate mannosyltransferase